MNKKYDVVVIGAGAAGMMAAITAASKEQNVLLLEKLSNVGAKLKATGGGRCNLTNKLSNDEFIEHFGRDGKFMSFALETFDSNDLIEFFNTIGVPTHAPDGFRVFPTTHSSTTIIKALQHRLTELNVTIETNQKVEQLLLNEDTICGVETQTSTYDAKKVIIATGGNGYPMLGATGDGYDFAKQTGHSVTSIHPAMMPLKTVENWVENCRADTIAKVTMYVNMKKYKKLKAKGDLIFTKNGIRGPVVLDFSREITPILDKHTEVPLLMNLTKGMNEEQIREHFKNLPELTTLQLVETLLPTSLSIEICKMANVDSSLTLKKQNGVSRDKLISLLAWTPLTINGHDGFKMAMITRGGVSLKDIDPYTMESKKVNGLYFCGEIVNLDGPCGGYNLQWSFSSGYLSGLQ